MTSSVRICLLGFGEVGQTLAADLLPRGVQLLAWDVLFANAASAPSQASARMEVRPAADARSAVQGVDLVISAVTAAQSIDAARSVAPHVKAGAYFFDLNSVSPAAKKEAHDLIDQAGGRYVEAAIMSPIAPRRVASPMLLGGRHAMGFLPLARQLGFSGTQIFSERLGAASAAKMCRSVVVKGMEALLCESLLTARRYGVERAVLESLKGLFPVEDWRAVARYMISRALIHGRRRAEELREAARTVADVGFQPHMSSACAQWQDWAAHYPDAAAHDDLDALLDQLIALQEEARRC